MPTSLNPGKPGALNWTVQNTTGVQANNLLLALNIDSVLTITGVTASPSTGQQSRNLQCAGPGIDQYQPGDLQYCQPRRPQSGESSYRHESHGQRYSSEPDQLAVAAHRHGQL